MDNPENRAHKTKKKTTQYVLDTTMCKHIPHPRDKKMFIVNN